MKIRTDFVTNSSSSCFTFSFLFELADGSDVHYWDSCAVVTVSPKQLGQAKDVEELIRLLEDGVLRSGPEGDIRIFKEYAREEKIATFFRQLREKVTSMDDIIWITLEGHDYHYYKHDRHYTYDRTNGLYEGHQFGEPGYEDPGGDLCLTDLDECTVVYYD